MNPSILVMALFSIAAPPAETASTPTTRLYVRTIPPGAEVRLDGEPAGKSDDLFVVPAGVRKMTIEVELDGHYPERQEVEIRGGRITRVELKMLRKAVAGSEKPAVAARSDAASAASPNPENDQRVVFGVAAKLDFRVAATRGDDKSGLSEAEVAEYKLDDPEKSRKSGRPYAWFELHAKEPTNLIYRDYLDRRYVLLCNAPDGTMLDVGLWGLKQIATGKDSQGQPCISVEFNDDGSRRIESLSGANIGRPMAFVINDVVASAPVLRSRITNRAQVTGRFTETEVKLLVDQLRPSPNQPAVGRRRFDEGAGSVIRDFSKNANDSVLPGDKGDAARVPGSLAAPRAPTRTAGISHALHFDGRAGSYVETPNLDMNRLTFATWVKRDVTSKKQDMIMSARYGGWGVYFSEDPGVVVGSEYQSKRHNQVWFTHRGMGGWHSDAEIADSRWHFVAVTLDDNSLSFYVDGKAAGNAAMGYTIDSGGSGYFLGGATEFPGESCHSLQGCLAETLVFNKPLNPAEIARLYNRGHGTQRIGRMDGMIAGYHFDEGGGTTAADFSGHGNTGTLKGGVTWVLGRVAAPDRP